MTTGFVTVVGFVVELGAELLVELLGADELVDDDEVLVGPAEVGVSASPWPGPHAAVRAAAAAKSTSIDVLDVRDELLSADN